MVHLAHPVIYECYVSGTLIQQRIKLRSLCLVPFIHVSWALSHLLHLGHGVEVRYIPFLEHLHAVLFAELSNFIKCIGREFLVAGSAELIAGHCLHGGCFA